MLGGPGSFPKVLSSTIEERTDMVLIHSQKCLSFQDRHH